MGVYNMLKSLCMTDKTFWEDILHDIDDAAFYYDRCNGGVNDEGLAERICDRYYKKTGAYSDYHSGATKVVFELSNLVFKIAFIGDVDYLDENEYEELDDEDKDGYEWNGWEWQQLQPYNREENPNYCNVEARVYQRAVEWGVEDFFAETVRIPNTNVYVQERYEMPVDDCGMSTLTQLLWDEGVEIIEAYHLGGRNIPTMVASYWFENYTSAQLERLSEFLRAFDINDLHSGNIAVFPDGSVKIIDYSGFCSNTSSLA